MASSPMHARGTGGETPFAAALMAVDGASCVVLADGARLAVRSRRTPTLGWRLTVSNGLEGLWDTELDESAATQHRRSLGRPSEDWDSYFGRVRRGIRAANEAVSLHFGSGSGSGSGSRGDDQQGDAAARDGVCTLTIYAADEAGDVGRSAGASMVAHTYRLEKHTGQDMRRRQARLFLDTVSTVSGLQDNLHDAYETLRREMQRAAAQRRQNDLTSIGGGPGPGEVRSPTGAAQLHRTGDLTQQEAQTQASGTKRAAPPRSLLNPAYRRKRARGAVIVSSSDDDE
jgi:hypothetical protein